MKQQGSVSPFTQPAGMGRTGVRGPAQTCNGGPSSLSPEEGTGHPKCVIPFPRTRALDSGRKKQPPALRRMECLPLPVPENSRPQGRGRDRKTGIGVWRWTVLLQLKGLLTVMLYVIRQKMLPKISARKRNGRHAYS